MNSYEKIYSALIEQYGHGSLPGKPTNPQKNNGNGKKKNDDEEEGGSMTAQEFTHYVHRPSRRKGILANPPKLKAIFKKLFGR